MFFKGIPFRRWSIPQHALMAGFIVIALSAGQWWWLQKLKNSLAALQNEYQAVQSQLHTAQSLAPVEVKKSFSENLPSQLQADEVARDISRFAQKLDVQITSLSVQLRPPSVSEIGKAQFTLAAHADYTSGKSWLGELLARYPSLSVQSLSIRAKPNNALRQDIHLTLVLFVKD